MDYYTIGRRRSWYLYLVIEKTNKTKNQSYIYGNNSVRDSSGNPFLSASAKKIEAESPAAVSASTPQPFSY